MKNRSPAFCRQSLLQAIAWLSLLPCIASAQIPVFADDFANGVAANSDTTTSFWTTSAPTNCSIVESGGALVITAGVDGTTLGNLNPYLNSASSEEFNFFRRKLRFSVTLDVSGAAPGNACTAALSLLGQGGKPFAVEDALTVRVRGDNAIFVGTKQGLANASLVAISAAVNNVVMPGKVTGFEFTIDAQNFSLKIYHVGGTGSTTITGLHGLIAAQWGTDALTALAFDTGRGNGSAGNSVVTISQLNVDRLNPPATTVFEDNFVSGPVANSDTETSVWASSLTPGGSVSKSAGNLLLTSTRDASATATASQVTPVAQRFDFFDQTLKISADVLVSSTGTLVNTSYRRPNRLLVASTAATAISAPDVFYIGLREGSILAGTKIDSPNTEPEDDTKPGNKHLIGTTDNLYDFSYAGTGGPGIEGVTLALDAKHYQLNSRSTGKASGRMRFSGLHGIDRSKWGAAGDSALGLESVVYNSAAAGDTTTTTWDSVKVEQVPDKLLAERYWDFKATFAYDTSNNMINAPFTVWLPSTEPVIRGVMFLGAGDGDDFRYLANDPVAQETARALGFALIGYRNPDSSGNARRANMALSTRNQTLIRAATQAVLDQAAAVSGHPEIKNAPLIMNGFSSGAFDASYMAAFWTERTIGFISHRGTVNYSTVNAGALKVPGLFIVGGNDTNGTTYPTLGKTNFNSWRAQHGLVAFAVNWRIGHTIDRDATSGSLGNQGWEASMTWAVEVANRRYPRPMLPPTGTSPTTWGLVDLAENSGWLGDNASFSGTTTPTVTNTFTPVAPFASYAGTVTAASWMPSEAAARMYQAFTSTDLVSTRTVSPLQTPLRIVKPEQYADPVFVNQPVSIEVDPREFTTSRTISRMDFYDGAAVLGSVTSGNDWRLSLTPTTVGLHTLTVVATGSDASKSSAFRVLHVVPTDYAPLVSTKIQSLSLATNGSASGSVSATDPEGDAVVYSVSTGAAKGTVVVNAATGSYTYRPAHVYSGTDSFVIRASAGATTDVTINVNVTALADSDNDGLPDAWETANTLSDPTDDPDGDGQNNLQEYLADTNPKVNSSVLKIPQFTYNASPPSYTVIWSTSGGVRYRVQYSDDLANAFTDLVRPASVEINSSPNGVAGTATFIDDFTLTPALASRRYYRIKAIKGS